MRIPHSAMRSLAAMALIGLMTGCGGGDSTAPDVPFDPAGTASDLDAVEASFESEAMAGFQSAAPAISAALGESAAAMAVRAAPSRMLASGKAGAREYAGAVARLYTRPSGGMRPVSPEAAILDEHLGVTFTRDPETLEYGPSDRTGAPSNGVRFIVYAVNPINGQPVTPLAEVGHADVVVTETASAASVAIELVSGGVTYLEYVLSGTANQSAGTATLTVSGFVSNGDDRVNFDLDTHLGQGSITLDYSLSVPTRGNFRIDFEEQWTNTTITSSLEMRGPHGTITMDGSWTANSGTYEVEVNGERFATITMTTGADPVITGAGGEPLTAEERETLRDVFLAFLGGFDFFEDLWDPLA